MLAISFGLFPAVVAYFRGDTGLPVYLYRPFHNTYCTLAHLQLPEALKIIWACRHSWYVTNNLSVIVLSCQSSSCEVAASDLGSHTKADVLHTSACWDLPQVPLPNIFWVYVMLSRIFPLGFPLRNVADIHILYILQHIPWIWTNCRLIS